MRRIGIIVGSIAMLALFIAIIGSGFILKGSFTDDDDVIKQIDLIEKAANESNWEQARVDFKSGQKAWEKVKNRIQFSVERIFIEDIDEELATLSGAIIAEDKEASIITTEKIKLLWKELGK